MYTGNSFIVFNMFTYTVGLDSPKHKTRDTIVTSETTFRVTRTKTRIYSLSEKKILI